MKLALKELQESHNCLKVISRRSYLVDKSDLDKIIRENNELIAIFIKSIQTAKNNLEKEQSQS